MSVRQRWWIDASIVVLAVALYFGLLAANSPIAWTGSTLVLGSIAGISWGRRRWT